MAVPIIEFAEDIFVDTKQHAFVEAVRASASERGELPDWALTSPAKSLNADALQIGNHVDPHSRSNRKADGLKPTGPMVEPPRCVPRFHSRNISSIIERRQRFAGSRWKRSCQCCLMAKAGRSKGSARSLTAAMLTSICATRCGTVATRSDCASKFLKPGKGRLRRSPSAAACGGSSLRPPEPRRWRSDVVHAQAEHVIEGQTLPPRENSSTPSTNATRSESELDIEGELACRRSLDSSRLALCQARFFIAAALRAPPHQAIRMPGYLT